MAAEPGETPSDDDVCRIAREAALAKFMELCGDENKVRETARLLGVRPSDGEPDIDCEAAFEEGFDEETCTDFEGLRQMVACLVWNENEWTGEPLIERHDDQLDAALEDAWDVAQEQCNI